MRGSEKGGMKATIISGGGFSFAGQKVGAHHSRKKRVSTRSSAKGKKRGKGEGISDGEEGKSRIQED